MLLQITPESVEGSAPTPMASTEKEICRSPGGGKPMCKATPLDELRPSRNSTHYPFPNQDHSPTTQDCCPPPQEFCPPCPPRPNETLLLQAGQRAPVADATASRGQRPRPKHMEDVRTPPAQAHASCAKAVGPSEAKTRLMRGALNTYIWLELQF